VMRCLEKKREQRYSTVAGLAADLARFLGVAEPAQPGSGVQSAPARSSIRPRSRVAGWFRKAMVYGGVTGVTAVLGWGVDAARDEASATQLPPANTALAAPDSAPVEPLVESVQPVDTATVSVAAAVPVSAVAPASAARQRIIDGGELREPPEATSPPRTRAALDRPQRAAVARANAAQAQKPSTLDMEARYALTYQPDADAEGSQSSPEPGGSDPAFMRSGL